jgi:hypothetical protein
MYMYITNEPWAFAHCWEVLQHEPKWNDKVLELNNSSRIRRDPKASAPASPVHVAVKATSETRTQGMEHGSELPERPEGRDASKRRRVKSGADSESSTATVNVLRQMHEKGQEQNEVETKYREEMMGLAKAKFELQQK